MINFKDEDEPQNETVRQTLERVARELGVFGATPTNNITHSPQPNQPAGFTPLPTQPAEQTSEIGTNHNGQPSQIVQTIFLFKIANKAENLAKTYCIIDIFLLC